MLVQTKNINKKAWLKEGFLLKMAPDRYLLGEGPFVYSSQPDPGQWSLFHPPFFGSFDERGDERGVSTGRGDWRIPSNTAFFSKKELLAFLGARQSSNEFEKSISWCSPDFSLFRERFLEAQKEIKQGLLKKVVPVFFETADFCLTEKAKRDFFHRLILAGAECGMAYAVWSEGQAIMGRTPEILFQVQQNHLQTMALAGTARDERHDLMKDQKERKEHEWVTESIKTTLKGMGECQISGPYVHTVGSLRHLRTDFEVNLNQTGTGQGLPFEKGAAFGLFSSYKANVKHAFSNEISIKKQLSFHQLCSCLHPTPALGGVPKEQALRLLEKWDHPPRYGFGAPFGVVLKDRAFCVVAIRNAQFLGEKVFIGSGVGLIMESDMEQEWRELKQKRDFIKSILFPSKKKG